MAGRAVEGNDASYRFNLYYKGDDVATNFITATGTGKVGLSTIPSDKFHISAAQDENALRIQVGGITKMRVLSNGGTSIGSNNLNTPTNGLYVAGNTGIGVVDPSDKLEVNGNVNISGGIKANGIVGAKNQLLSSTSSGDLAWVNPCEFNRFECRWSYRR